MLRQATRAGTQLSVPRRLLLDAFPRKRKPRCAPFGSAWDAAFRRATCCELGQLGPPTLTTAMRTTHTQPAVDAALYTDSELFMGIKQTLTTVLRSATDADVLEETTGFEAKFEADWRRFLTKKPSLREEVRRFCEGEGHSGDSDAVMEFVKNVCLGLGGGSTIEFLNKTTLFSDVRALLVPKSAYDEFCTKYTSKVVSHKYPGVHAILNSTASSSLTDREALKTSRLQYIETESHREIVGHMKRGCRVMVQGGSGDGKTVTMLHAASQWQPSAQPKANETNAIVVYLLGDAVTKVVEGSKDYRAMCELRELPDRQKFRDSRNKLVREALVECMLNCVSNATTKDRATSDPKFLTDLLALPSVHLTFCVDEAGSCELVTQAMTQIEFLDVKQIIEERAGKTSDLTIRLLVGGTGIGCSNTPSGSLPGSFEVIRVQLGGSEWHTLVASPLSENKEKKELIDLIESEPLMRAACGNARLAALVGEELRKSFKPKLLKSLKAGRRAFLHHIFFAAVCEFKALNGIKNLSWDDLEVVLSFTLRAYFFPMHHGLCDNIARHLATRYGLLVDLAQWREETKVGGWTKLKEDGDMHLCAPGDGRYAISASTVAMLVMMLMKDTSLSSTTSTGKELEAATQLALTLLVMACSRESELVHLLQSPKPTFKKFDDDEVAISSPVTVFNAARGANPRCITAPTVILAEDKAPFADVAVLFGGLAILVQCKDTKAKLHDGGAQGELKKMGFSKSDAFHLESHSDGMPFANPPETLTELLARHCGVSLPATQKITRCVPVILYRADHSPDSANAKKYRYLELSFNGLMHKLHLQLQRSAESNAYELSRRLADNSEVLNELPGNGPRCGVDGREVSVSA